MAQWLAIVPCFSVTVNVVKTMHDDETLAPDPSLGRNVLPGSPMAYVRPIKLPHCAHVITINFRECNNYLYESCVTFWSQEGQVHNAICKTWCKMRRPLICCMSYHSRAEFVTSHSRALVRLDRTNLYVWGERTTTELLPMLYESWEIMFLPVFIHSS